MKVVNMGFYPCNAYCIMLIMTKITLRSLIPLDEDRKIPPVSEIKTKKNGQFQTVEKVSDSKPMYIDP